MFGPIDSGEISTNSYLITIEYMDGVIVYRRLWKNSRECIVTKTITGKDVSIEFVPMYPIFIPQYLSNYILCKFRNSIVVAPKSSIEVYFLLPIEYAVYVRTRKYFDIVDVFSDHSKNKYSLYGPIEKGIVAKYLEVVSSTKELKLTPGYALTKLVIVNNVNDFVEVSRVLLDAHPLKLYYRLKSWHVYTQLLRLEIISKNTAIVYYDKPFTDNVIELEDPVMIRPPRLYSRTDMLWGL